MKCLPKSLFFLFLLGAFGASAQTGFDTGVPLPSGGTLVVPFDVKDRIEKPYESINVGGETRTYGFYKSTKITGGQRPALVIALHGNTADGNLMAVQTSFDQKAEDESFIVVYPNGKTVTAPTFNIPGIADRKSTRLNSSHQIISYAVFCLKKKIVAFERDTRDDAMQAVYLFRVV